MGKSSRDKGARGELEAAEYLPGSRKVSAMYRPGPDLVWLGRQVEVKRRAEPISKTLEKYLADASMVMTRHDGETVWRMYLTVDTLLDIIDEAHTDARASGYAAAMKYTSSRGV